MSNARLLPWILALLVAGAEAFTTAPALRTATRVTPAMNPRGCRHAPRMSLQSIEPEPRMSGAIIHKGLVYTCGMVCEEGGEGKDVKQQTKDALDELDRILALSKSDKHHILSMQAWVDDLAYLDDMNSVYDEWVSKTMPPGRACVSAKLVPPYKVEFRAIAAQIE